MDGAVLVDARGGARTVPALNMRCDKKEIPDPLNAEKTLGSWFSRVQYFGPVQRGGETGQLGNPELIRSQENQGAVVVCADRVIGISAPESVAVPALWWSWPLTDVTVQTAGKQGLLKKRPEVIMLDFRGGADGNHQDGATVALKAVSEYHREIKSYQTGRENALLAALSRSSGRSA